LSARLPATELSGSERASLAQIPGSEKGANNAIQAAPAEQMAMHRPHGRSLNGRPLGLVNVGLLRGSRASHDPLVAAAVQAGVTAANPLSHPRLSGQGERRCSRHEVPGAIGVGAKSPP